LTADELEAALRAVEPAARLVPERRLLRLLVYLRDHGRPLPLNADLPVRVARAEAVAADVLPPAALAGDEPVLLLMTAPDDRLLGGLPRPELLRAYWRLLLQDRVAEAVRAAGPKAVAAAADALGPPAVREIRYVLGSDHRIDPDADTGECFAAFAATFADLQVFDPPAVGEFFPSVRPEAAAAAFAELAVDVPAALHATRPAGAAGPGAGAPPPARTERGSAGSIPPAPGAADWAGESYTRGNYVRAAILHTQAAAGGRRKDRDREEKAARDHLGMLVHGLARACGWDRRTVRAWKDALEPLLEPAASGWWPHAARCLYELQKIAADLSGEVSAVDLVESVRTLGRRPVVRPLPHAREVRLLVRLRAAHRQFLRSGVRSDELDHLFHDEIHRVERRVRADLTPLVHAALEGSGFRPANRVEEVARDKLVAELLDRACERGFLRLGDLRDAVARNRLKMPDLRGPGEFLAGDPLLRADVRLSHDLDGVYRRGEVYLRWLQRGSSVFFGTGVGRFLTRYAVGPFLAAFLLLMTVEEFYHLGGKVAAFAGKVLAPRPAPVEEPAGPPWWADPDGWPEPDLGEAGAVVTAAATSSAAEADHDLGLVTWPAVLGLGVVFLLLFHVPAFRAAVLAGLKVLGRAIRAAVWDFPRAVWRSPLVRRVWYSRPARFAGRWLAGPIVFTAVVVLGMWLLGASAGRLVRWGLAVFACAAVALNTGWGRVLQDRFVEQLSDAWRLVRVNLLPGLVAAVLDAFARLADWVEQRLYAVDEWFRYRAGDSRRSVVGKAILGLVWFPVAYLARFAFYLLIEPQINPVKHFPVVTVSHKVILPMAPSLADALNVSEATAVFVLGCIPGVFGFIAWELMANWRLYAANRPGRLRPAVVGSHGETVRGLLRPGFHSGTVPKLFGKLRGAARRGDDGKASRARHELDHVREAAERFADRELVGLLQTRPGWAGLRVGAVRFGCQRLVVEIAAPDLGPDPVGLAFENRAGGISAAIESPGWLGRLDPVRREELLAAVRGLFDLAAAEAVGETPRRPDPDPEARPDDLRRPFGWADWVAYWDRPGPAAGRDGPATDAAPGVPSVFGRPHDPARP
jgi:hypothetical protein